MQELTNLKSQLEVEEKIRQHSDSQRISTKKRNSGYMKYVSKRSSHIQPLYGINFEEEENDTRGTSQKVENPEEDLPEEFEEMRGPSMSADQELLIGSLQEKYKKMKEENKKLKEDYVSTKEKQELLQSGCKELEKYNEDLKKQNLDTQKELETRDNRIKYLETRFKYLKENCDKKDKEIQQYKNEIRKMKTAQVYDNNMRRSTELIEAQMAERLGKMVGQHNRSASTKVNQKSQFGEDMNSKVEGRKSLAGINRGRVQESGDSTPQNIPSRSSSSTSRSQQDSSFNPPGSESDNQAEISLDSPRDMNILIKHQRNQTKQSLALLDNVVPESDEESDGVSKNLTAQKSDLSMNDLQSQEGLNNFNLGAQIFEGPFDYSKPASYIPPGGDTRGQEYLRVSTLKNWSLSDADLKNFFILNLIICKADYPDFDNYAEIDLNQSFEKLKEQQIEPIQYLRFAKQKVRYTYREAKLKASNIEPTKFAFRLWTLKDIVNNQYLEDPDIMNSFFYPKARLSTAKFSTKGEEEEKETEIDRLKGSIHQVFQANPMLIEGSPEGSISGSEMNRKASSAMESDYNV